MYLRLLQFAYDEVRQAVLAQLPTELPTQLRLSLLLLRRAQRASTDHVQLASATAFRFQVTAEFRLLLASLRRHNLCWQMSAVSTRTVA